jgi:hypothetical protein
MKDPQCMYDYLALEVVDFVALDPKAPYRVALEDIEGLEAFWDCADSPRIPSFED